jgi:hypothetical protein
MDNLLPCPFCDAEMMLSTDAGPQYFVHPQSDRCPLRNRAWYVEHDLEAWNTRKASQLSRGDAE